MIVIFLGSTHLDNYKSIHLLDSNDFSHIKTVYYDTDTDEIEVVIGLIKEIAEKNDKKIERVICKGQITDKFTLALYEELIKEEQ